MATAVEMARRIAAAIPGATADGEIVTLRPQANHVPVIEFGRALLTIHLDACDGNDRIVWHREDKEFTKLCCPTCDSTALRYATDRVRCTRCHGNWRNDELGQQCPACGAPVDLFATTDVNGVQLSEAAGCTINECGWMGLPCP